jgi:competence protein ComEC
MPVLRPHRPILWRSRPLLSSAAVLALGIASAQHLAVDSVDFWSLLISASIIVAAALSLAPRRRIVSLRPLAVTVCVALSLFSLGGLRLALWTAGRDAPLSFVAAEVDASEHGMPLLIRGRLIRSPVATEGRLQFTLRVDSAGFDRLSPISGVAEVTVWRPREAAPSHHALSAEAWPDLQPGHLVLVEGMLRPLPRRRNPADFDYGAFLQRRGIHAVISGSGAEAITVVGYEPSRSERILSAARQHVRTALHEHVGGDQTRAVMQALLLADRSAIDPEIRRGFARTGLAHLLAVSGLHVFLVGMVLYGLLKPFLHRLGWSWKRVEIGRAVLTMFALGAYVSVVGGPASAVRALVMATAFIAGRAFERPANALNSLGGAGLVLLLVRPSALLDVGFQLSFAAVGALILVIPTLENLLPAALKVGGIRRYISQLVLASIAATLGTMPVLLVHFGTLPIAGIPLNVIAIPATAMALAGGLLAVLFHGWATPLAVAAGASSDFFANIVLSAGLLGERWLGWTTVDLYVRDAFVVLTLALAILALSFWYRPRLRWRTSAYACACLSVAIWIPLIRGDQRPVMNVIFFDVGQGDAALVTLPNGRRLLIDAGPIDPYGDAGTRTLIPHFDRFGIRRLHGVVVSHPHSDHLGGVPAVLSAVRVDTLYDNGEVFDSELYRRTTSTASDRNVPVRALSIGDDLRLDPHVRIHVLHPGPEPDAHTNDASVVLYITYGNVALLFAGDAESAAEATLTGRFGETLCADAVKVAHHGSRTSSTSSFVEAATSCRRMQYAVVSVARRNRYNLPNTEALERWIYSGAELLQTSENGAVWLRTDGRRLWRHHWR